MKIVYLSNKRSKMEIPIDQEFWKSTGEYNSATHPELSYNRGEFNYTNGNYREALLDFNSYLKLHPNDVKTLIYIGEIYCNSKHYKEAIPFYEQGFSEATGKFGKHVYYNYAVCLFEVEAYEKALHAIDQLLQKERNYSLAYNLKGSILLQLDRYENAFYYCTKALEYDKTNWHAFATRVKINYCLGDYYRVVHDFKKAQTLNPDLPAHYYTTHAFALHDMNKRDEAILEFERASLLGDEEAKDVLKKLKKHN